MKLKNWWGISTLILTTIGTAIPVALTTSCVEKRDWVFNNYGDIDNYLQQHKQNVSEGYFFSDLSNQTDYEFLKKNVNLQLFINSVLFDAWVSSHEIGIVINKLELHTKNKTTVEFDLQSESEERMINTSGVATKKIVMYDDFLFTCIDNNNYGFIYDFKEDWSETHFYAVDFPIYNSKSLALFNSLSPKNTIASELQSASELTFRLSPYDWTNHFLFGSTR